MLTLKDLQKAKFKAYSGSTVPYAEFLSTGLIGVDYLLGGGAVRGLYLEIVGNTNLGKSTLSLHMADHYLSTHPGQVLYIDTEGRARQDGLIRLFREKLEEYGERFLVSPTRSVQEVYQLIDFVGAADFDGMIIVDSLPGMYTQEDKDEALSSKKNIEDRAPGSSMSRAMGKLAKLLSAQVSEHNLFGIMVNQTRAKMSMYSSNIDRPGGEAAKFIYSHTLVLKGTNKPNKDITTLDGLPIVDVAATTEKADFAPARMTASYGLTAKGLDPYFSMYHLLVEGDLKGKVLTKDGNSFFLPNECPDTVFPVTNGPIATKKAGVYDFLATPENRPVYEWLYNHIIRNYTTKGKQEHGR